MKLGFDAVGSQSAVCRCEEVSKSTSDAEQQGDAKGRCAYKLKLRRVPFKGRVARIMP